METSTESGRGVVQKAGVECGKSVETSIKSGRGVWKECGVVWKAGVECGNEYIKRAGHVCGVHCVVLQPSEGPGDGAERGEQDRGGPRPTVLPRGAAVPDRTGVLDRDAGGSNAGQRTFDREFYTGVLVRSSDAAVRKTLELAQAHVAADTRFGVLGGRTFCSKLVLDLLCNSGMLGESAPACSLMETPRALFRILQKILQKKTFVSQPLSAISFADKSFATKTVDPRRSAVAFLSSPDMTESQKDNVPEDMLLLLGA